MTVIDTLNESQDYWERILEESNLSLDREESEPIEITAEELLEISNVELLPEEDYRLVDEVVINYTGRTLDSDTSNSDHSGLGETNDELRTKIDSNDTFFTGHSVIKPRLGDAGSKTGVPRRCPDWANSNEKIRQLLLLSFPNLATNAKQRAKAGRWARVIQLYYRKQMTHGQIAEEMATTIPTVQSIIRGISRAVSGKTANGSGKRKRA